MSKLDWKYTWNCKCVEKWAIKTIKTETGIVKISRTGYLHNTSFYLQYISHYRVNK